MAHTVKSWFQATNQKIPTTFFTYSGRMFWPFCLVRFFFVSMCLYDLFLLNENSIWQHDNERTLMRANHQTTNNKINDRRKWNEIISIVFYLSSAGSFLSGGVIFAANINKQNSLSMRSVFISILSRNSFFFGVFFFYCSPTRRIIGWALWFLYMNRKSLTPSKFSHSPVQSEIIPPISYKQIQICSFPNWMVERKLALWTF